MMKELWTVFCGESDCSGGACSSRCSFMNFARNMKCRECDKARPKRELTGGDWECPQNTLCLKCNCKRHGEASFGTSGLGWVRDSNPNKAEIESMLAANEEKAERWFLSWILLLI